MKIAFISQGKLFVKQDESAAELIESDFGRKMVDQGLKNQQKHEWKSKGRGAEFMGSSNPWGASSDEDPQSMRINISAVCRGAKQGDLTYALDTDEIGGLFRYEAQEKLERRLFHRQHTNICHIDQHPQNDKIVCSLMAENGSSNLFGMSGSGRLDQLTEGDSVDMAPSWIPDEENTLLYQSAGIGRTGDGFYAGLAPFTLTRMCKDSGKMETVCDDENLDYLMPHADAQGRLYYITRPYEHPDNRVTTSSPFALIKDILFFPFRLARAGIAFLNMFSMMFSGKPLTTAGGAKKESRQNQVIWLMGRMIDVDKTMKKNKGNAEKSLVPKNWQLIRREKNGEEQVLATNVLCFDVNEAGEVIHSDGYSVYKHCEGKNELLFKDKLVEQLALV